MSFGFRWQFGLLTILAIQHCSALVEPNSGPIVHLKNGVVQGLVVEADGARKVNFFQGIRFGRAKRFYKPTPVEPWTEVYNATKIQFSCPQLNEGPTKDPNVVINEDCLFLNVWTPGTAGPKSNLSVMVWIYGGGFQGGSIFQDFYDSKQIAGLGDVVVVSVNYRLGPLGFANFGTKETPGNLGLHDQILGLKWVQDNIRQFGGNPEDVTIFGESAGSVSVGALILSPLTTGLFHRAILQSGSPKVRVFAERQTNSLEKTMRFALRMGCEITDFDSAMKCLQRKTPEELVKSTVNDLNDMETFFPLFGDEVLPEDPVLTLEKFDRKVDLLFGLCRNEGSRFIEQFFPKFDMKNITLESVKKGIVEILLKLKIGTKGFNSVLDHYTKSLTQKSSQNQLRIAVSDVFGDYFLVCPTVLFGEQMARLSLKNNNSRSHFYAYRLMTKVNVSQLPSEEWMGVTHGEDINYMFGMPITYNGKLSGITKRDVQLSRDMIGAWTQFAKTGQIQPVSGSNWTEAIDNQKPEQSLVSYFSLDPTDYRMVNDYWKVTCEQVWKPLLEAQ